MHVRRLGCIYHTARPARLGSARLVRRLPSRVRKARARMLHACVRDAALSRVHRVRGPREVHARRAPRKRERDVAGRFHAWTMAAVTLKHALPLSYAPQPAAPSVARATCATSSARLSPFALAYSETLVRFFLLKSSEPHQMENVH